jgi:plastocyanin
MKSRSIIFIILVNALITSVYALVDKSSGMTFFNREVSVLVTDSGYYPSKLSFFEGERVKFYLTGVDLVKSKCMMITETKLFLAANNNLITEGEVHFKRPGVYYYYCPSSGFRGRITVLRKKRSVQRKIASKVIRKVWMPQNDMDD